MDIVALDVRIVEPKRRFELIMGAYEELAVGQTLELTVDHDPKCMYYTLKATRGDDAFAFDYLDSGPEMWRVRVRKSAVGFVHESIARPAHPGSRSSKNRSP